MRWLRWNELQRNYFFTFCRTDSGVKFLVKTARFQFNPPSRGALKGGFKLRGFFPPPEKICVYRNEIAEAFWPLLLNAALVKVVVFLSLRVCFSAPHLFYDALLHISTQNCSSLSMICAIRGGKLLIKALPKFLVCVSCPPSHAYCIVMRNSFPSIYSTFERKNTLWVSKTFQILQIL